MGQSDSKLKADEERLLALSSSERTTTTSKVVNHTLSCASNITKILPTGISFVFQVLSNLLSNNGDCETSNKILIGVVLGILGIACFVLSLIDTFTDDSTGKVQWGIATVNGLSTGNKVKPSDKSKYKLNFKDFVHATVAVVVFAVMALTNVNVVQCLYPSEQRNIKKMYQAIPIAVVGVSSVIFVLIPSKRQGVTCPVSSSTSTTG